MSFTNSEDEKYTIMAVRTVNRPGLLQALSKTLADLALEVHKADINTDGALVNDRFFISDRVRFGGASLLLGREEKGTISCWGGRGSCGPWLRRAVLFPLPPRPALAHRCLRPFLPAWPRARSSRAPRSRSSRT